MSLSEAPSPSVVQPRATYSVPISDDLQRRADEVHTRGMVDNRDTNRSRAQRKNDARRGALAEVAAAEVLRSAGVPVRHYEDWETDLVLGENTWLDVKYRDHTRHSYTDLLVRDRRPDVELHSDGFLQVFLDDERATVTGWAHRKQVDEADWFEKAVSHPTRIIPHDELRPVSRLVRWFR